MIFKVPHLVSFISQVMTLEPGDVIATGTPAGVCYARDPQVYMKPGDDVEVEIDGIVILRNPVVNFD
jgi:acylpyruvate hydrolase